MKALLTPAILAVAALMLGTTLLLICAEPPPSPLSVGLDSTNQGFVFSRPTPIDLYQRPGHQLLTPGVYQTYPYTIILVVPKKGIDDRILANVPRTNSSMPVLKPHVEVIPKP